MKKERLAMGQKGQKLMFCQYKPDMIRSFK